VAIHCLIKVAEYLKVLYNSKRPHKSLELVTPVDYIFYVIKIAAMGRPIHRLALRRSKEAILMLRQDMQVAS
jgi:hypothetical protein